MIKLCMSVAFFVDSIIVINSIVIACVLFYYYIIMIHHARLFRILFCNFPACHVICTTVDFTCVRIFRIPGGYPVLRNAMKLIANFKAHALFA